MLYRPQSQAAKMLADIFIKQEWNMSGDLTIF